MRHFVVYSKRDGRIQRTGFCSEADVELQPEGGGEAVVLAAGPVRFEDHFVVDGKVLLRPEMALRLDKSAVAVNEIATLSGIPEGCELTFEGQTHIVSGGVVEWSSAEAGSYELLFSCFPFRDVAMAIEVVE